MLNWIKNAWKKISELGKGIDKVLGEVDGKLDEGLKAIEEDNIDKIRDIINEIKLIISIAKKIL